MALLMLDGFDQLKAPIDWEKVWPEKDGVAPIPNFLAALLANSTAGVNAILPEGAFTITPMKVEDGVVKKWEVEVMKVEREGE